jgi:DNA excision repair protein ERCC-8
MELFSAHGDGTIRAWVSRTEEDEMLDEETEEAQREERKRKRDVLEEVYRGLMTPSVAFT